MIISLLYIVNSIGLFSLVYYFLLSKTNVTKSIFPYVLLVAFSSIVDIFIIHLLQLDSEKWSQVYMCLEFIVLWKVFTSNGGPKFRYVSFFFLVFFYLSFFYFNVLTDEYSSVKSDGILSIITFVYIIFFSIYWFLSIFEKVDVPSLLNLPLFYFVSGLIIYHSGTLFLFLMSDEIKNSELSLYEYWIVNLILVLLLRLLLLVAIWKGRKT